MEKWQRHSCLGCGPGREAVLLECRTRLARLHRFSTRVREHRRDREDGTHDRRLLTAGLSRIRSTFRYGLYMPPNGWPLSCAAQRRPAYLEGSTGGRPASTTDRRSPAVRPRTATKGGGRQLQPLIGLRARQKGTRRTLKSDLSPWSR